MHWRLPRFSIVEEFYIFRWRNLLCLHIAFHAALFCFSQVLRLFILLFASETCLACVKNYQDLSKLRREIDLTCLF